MLLKSIITKTEKILHDPSQCTFTDLMLSLEISTDEITEFRKYILDACRHVKPYYVDIHAGELLKYDVEHMSSDDMESEIDLPQDLIWVEFSSMILIDNIREWDTSDPRNVPDVSGILIDNRSSSRMVAYCYVQTKTGILISPYVEHFFEKGGDGSKSLRNSEFNIFSQHQEIEDKIEGMDMSIAETSEIYREKAEMSYFVVHALTRALAKRKDDLIISEKGIFSDKELKNARKFGKKHILDAPKSHITISLTEPAKKALEVNLELDRKARENGLERHGSVVKHGVREHLRRCQSGKMVTVRSHVRGTEEDVRPVRVTG